MKTIFGGTQKEAARILLAITRENLSPPIRVLKQAADDWNNPQVDNLGGIVRQQNRPFPVINGAKSDGKPWFSVTNDASKAAAVITIYDQIGKDWWSGEGVGAKDYREALDKIDPTRTRALDVHINSPGGNVYDGLAIRSIHREWKGKVNTFNDGLAASIASVILLSPANGGRIHASKESSTMIHRASTVAVGTVDDMQRAISALEAAEKNILSAYVEKTGKTEAELSDAMAKETWFTGQEAKDFGLVDEVTTASPIQNNFDLSNFRRVPEAFRKLQNSAPSNGGPLLLMNRTQIIARLNKMGCTVDDKSTDEQLLAQLEAAITALEAKAAANPAPAAPAAPNATENAALELVKAQLKSITEASEKNKRKLVETRVDALIQERRIDANERNFWVTQGVADEANLEIAAKRTPQLPPEGISVECVSESIDDICNHAKRLGREIVMSRDFCAVEDKFAAERMKAANQARSAFLRKFENRIGQIWNTNTVDSTLKQDVIVDQVLKEFSRVLLPLARFSTLFSNIALKGNGIVQVPFLAIRTDASATDFVDGTGYTTVANTTNDNRPITIDKRKYLHIGHSSSELARQPFLFVKEQLMLLGQQLAYLVWLDVMSVVSAANFGAATAPAGSTASSWPVAAAAMDSNKIADLQLIADTARFPIGGRVLFVNGAYDNALKKDNSFKHQLNFGGTEVMRDGRIPNVYGFDYYNNVFLPTNSENLAGIIANRQAIIIATAMIPPTEEVRRAGTIYSQAVDADTGIPLEYRSFGNNVTDATQQGFECNYGFAKGDANALFRLPTA